MDIKYSIQFHTDWHCGSGLAAGSDVDALVVKDKDGLPFVPGKTMKGLVREAIEEMNLSKESFDRNLFVKAFGNSEDRNAKLDLTEKSEKYDFLQKGETFFTNAELSEDEHRAIVSNNAARFMYRSISSTAIDNEGIAVDHSLRKMEVVVPCNLEGKIIGVEDRDWANEILKALLYIKRLGQNRNRGLGRCTITGTIIEEGGEK